MGWLSAVGTGLMNFLNTSWGANIAGTIAGTATNAIANSIGNSLNKSSSSQAEMGSTMNDSSSSSSGYQNVQQATGAEATTEQQGNTAGIANALISALGTPTGNNAGSAATFSQQSAQTANNLQQSMWNQGNMLNIISNAMGNILNAVSQSSAKRYNEKQNDIARKFNEAQSRATREWQERMRETAYQTTVEDLKKAGLNPILAATNGATGNYTGAEASSGAASIGAQGYSGTNSMGVPSAHTATMQAMYDYGNNTSQFVNNMLQTINTAKQMGYTKEASWLESAMSEGTQSSAKTISDYANSSSKSSFESGKSTGQTDSNSKTKSWQIGAEGYLSKGSGYRSTENDIQKKWGKLGNSKN